MEPLPVKASAQRGMLWKLFQYFKLFGLNPTHQEWEELYRNIPVHQLPWESGQPSPTLVRFVKEGKIRGAVLDVGCGAGTHAVWMAEQGLKISGIDISETAIMLSRALAQARNVAVDFRVGNALRLPYADANFDAVFDRGTYHHQDRSKDVYVQELARVLKPRGKYLLLAFSSKMRWPKSVGLKEIEERFGKYFHLESLGEELHVQPDGRNVWLRAVLMTKHHDRPV